MEKHLILYKKDIKRIKELDPHQSLFIIKLKEIKTDQEIYQIDPNEPIT